MCLFNTDYNREWKSNYNAAIIVLLRATVNSEITVKHIRYVISAKYCKIINRAHSY